MKFAFSTFLTVILGAFVMCAHGQDSPYPNEIEGFQFFGQGKLEGLRFSVSSKSDIARIFGEACDRKCNYNDEFFVRFEFYDDIWIRESRNEKGEKVRLTLSPQYVGTLRAIELRPKARLPFLDRLPAGGFTRLIESSTVHDKSNNARMVLADLFRDADGLSYKTYSGTNYDDIKDPKARRYEKGDLISIRYEISKDIENKLFVTRD